MPIADTSLMRLTGAIMLLFVTACQISPEGPRYPELRFTDTPQIRLDVAVIEYVEEYLPPQAEPNVDHYFPVSPASSVRNWSNDRLVAAGSSGRARVTLVDASVIEVALEETTGLAGAFTTDQSERYEATVEVRVEIFDDKGNQIGQARTLARRSQTAAEGITLNERDALWYALTRALMKDVDRELELTIARYLAKFTI